MDTLMQWLGPHNMWLAFGVLFAAGMFEYLFPPVPGDTTMLLGFFLVGRGDLPPRGSLPDLQPGLRGDERSARLPDRELLLGCRRLRRSRL